jgi:hypothetical protein
MPRRSSSVEWTLASSFSAGPWRAPGGPWRLFPRRAFPALLRRAFPARAWRAVVRLRVIRRGLAGENRPLGLASRRVWRRSVHARAGASRDSGRNQPSKARDKTASRDRGRIERRATDPASGDRSSVGRPIRPGATDHPGRPSAYRVRIRRNEGRATAGSVDSADRSSSVRTGGTCSPARTSRPASGDSPDTDRWPASGATTPSSRSSAGTGGGEGGIRTHEVFRLSAFQERRHQPLGHLSGAEDTSDVERVRDPDRVISAGWRSPTARSGAYRSHRASVEPVAARRDRRDPGPGSRARGAAARGPS